MNYPVELKYTKDHEWLKMEGDIAVVGITDFAQDALGDVVFINLPDVGDPVTGVVVEINEELIDSPELLNEDPYGAWIIKVENITGEEDLLDAAAYEALCAEEG